MGENLLANTAEYSLGESFSFHVQHLDGIATLLTHLKLRNFRNHLENLREEVDDEAIAAGSRDDVGGSPLNA